MNDGGHDGRTHAGYDLDEVVAREQARYGGVKIGAAFFGWLAATGTAVLLTGLLAATGAAVGLADPAMDGGDSPAVGIVGAVLLVLVLFVSYYCGGYVAGRMARFNGARQGFAVWIWAVLMALLLAGLGVLAGSRFDVLASVNGFPRLPVNEGTISTVGIIAAVSAAVASLGGALLGGMVGVRFHRKVDRAGVA